MRIVIILFCVLLFISCTNENKRILPGSTVITEGIRPLNGSGEIVKKSIVYGPFNSVTLSIPAKLSIKSGNEYKVSYQCYSNITDCFEVRKTNSTLSIFPKGSFNTDTPIIFDITLPKLHYFGCDSNSQVVVENFKGQKLNLDVFGMTYLELNNIQVQTLSVKAKALSKIAINSLDTNSMAVHLSDSAICKIVDGSTFKQSLLIQDQGQFFGKHFESFESFVTHDGMQDLTIAVTNTLNVDLLSSGSIFYIGAPKKMQVQSEGRGTIQRLRFERMKGKLRPNN